MLTHGEHKPTCSWRGLLEKRIKFGHNNDLKQFKKNFNYIFAKNLISSF